MHLAHSYHTAGPVTQCAFKNAAGRFEKTSTLGCQCLIPGSVIEKEEAAGVVAADNVRGVPLHVLSRAPGTEVEHAGAIGGCHTQQLRKCSSAWREQNT